MEDDSAEPTTLDAVAAWARAASAARDIFADVFTASESHREAHGPRNCTVYPSSNGPLLGVLAMASRPARILEIGTGLGYSALWLTHGAPAATVDTCERDPAHAALAREQIGRYGVAERVTVHAGGALETLAGFDIAYALIFLDADLEQYPALFAEFTRLLAPGGLLVSSNLFLGVHVPEDPTLAFGVRYRELLLKSPELVTAWLATGLAMSVRRAP